MAVADLLNQPATPWRTCATCHALDTLEPPKADILRKLLASNIRYDEISVELATDPDWRLEIPRDALSRHARGQCSRRERLRG